MALFSFFKKKQNIPVRIILFFDIGRGNCRGALAAALPGKPLAIFHRVAGEERITVREYAKALPVALASLSAVLEDLSKTLISLAASGNYALTVEEVTCLLASPYYLAKTSTARFHQEKPFTVTRPLVDTIIREAERKMKEAMIRQNPEVLGDGKTSILSKKIVRMLANGYAVKDPYGKSVKTLEISFFETEIATQVEQAIRQNILRFFNVPVRIESLALGAWMSVRQLFPELKEFLAVSVGKSVTEISLAREYSLAENTSFPYGKHLIVRHIARKLHTTPESALFRLTLLQEGKISEEEKQKLIAPIDDAKSEWLLFFEDAAVSIAGTNALPPFVVLFVDGDPKGTLTDLISHDSFASQTLTHRAFEILPLTYERYLPYCYFEGNVTFDVFLASGALLSVLNRRVERAAPATRAPEKPPQPKTTPMQKTGGVKPPLSTRIEKSSMVQSAS